MARGLDLLKETDLVGLGLEPVGLSPAHPLEVAAGAEGRAGAAYHHRAYARVAFERVEALAERFHERGVERVSPFRTIQRDGPDAVGDRVQDLVGHEVSPVSGTASAR